jgi:signal transduction histidine kinase
VTSADKPSGSARPATGWDIIRTTQSQVIAVAAGSVLLAHFIILAMVVMSNARRDPAEGPPNLAPLRAFAAIYASNPDGRSDLLRHAAAAGFTLREIPADLARLCAPPGPHPNCPPHVWPTTLMAVPATPQTWIGTDPGPRPHHRAPLGPTLIAILGLPTLALSIWASRFVTAPLRRLAEAAERVDPETATAPLAVEGPSEMRLLAEAFNRLILRLTRYAADQRRVLGAVSHDLRTPLTRLRLRADTIADGGLREKFLRDIASMQLLIDRALSLLQVQDTAVTPSRVDLAALLQSVADDMVDSGVPVTVTNLSPLVARCDAPMLTRAVANLLENAAKYANGGTLQLYESDRRAVIEVSDQGPGLTDTEKAHAFEAWYRGDAARGGQGSGLGLAIVRAAMANLGGKVELADAVPHGLVARLSLPL